MSESANLSCSILILYVSKSTSTKTGTKPFWMMGVMVVGNHAATVIISSHFFNCLAQSSLAVKAVIASRFAELHELAVMTYFVPKNSENFFSNISFHLPSVR
ncbi:MAG: hypothetical protein WCH65_06570 [bacterium]